MRKARTEFEEFVASVGLEVKWAEIKCKDRERRVPGLPALPDPFYYISARLPYRYKPAEMDEFLKFIEFEYDATDYRHEFRGNIMFMDKSYGVRRAESDSRNCRWVHLPPDPTDEVRDFSPFDFKTKRYETKAEADEAMRKANERARQDPRWGDNWSIVLDCGSD